MDAEENDGQAVSKTKPTISTWRHASEPWTVGYTNPDGVAACNYFLYSLREVLPEATQVREALAFAKLLMLHPDPPADHRELHGSLWAAATVDESEPGLAANRLRELAALAIDGSGYTASGNVFELGLASLALKLDDTPSHRMRCIELGLLFGGVVVPGLQDITPSWKRDGSPCFISPGILQSWVAGHVETICTLAADEATSPSTLSECWSCQDVECALLALRMHYCIFRTPLESSRDSIVDLAQDFEDVGLPTWDWLEAALSLSSRPADTAGCASLKQAAWHVRAKLKVRISLRVDPKLGDSSTKSQAGRSRGSDLQDELSPVDLDADEDAIATRPIPTLTVCRSPIVKSSDRYDKEELARHKILETPLPLAVMPTPETIRAKHARLLAEFPWGESVLAAIFNELMGRAQLGVQVLGMPATLLVGSPGCGKSRLARRIAEELGLPRLDLALGGTSDSKVLGGTSRGWGSGKPNDLATLLATRGSASAIVMLDELDKAVDHHREAGGIQSYLLGLLEPETACRHMDVYLKTECDFSGVLWIATANRLSSIQAPLVSRLRVLMLGQPMAQHYPEIAENVVGEMAQRWGLARQILPSVPDLELPLDQLTSARQVRVATETAVMAWARDLQRH